MSRSTYALMTLLLVSGAAPIQARAQGRCPDPVPVNIRIFTEEMQLQAYTGASQQDAVCYLSWEGESAPTLEIFGPTWFARHGQQFRSSEQAAAHYPPALPLEPEPMPGPSGAILVFDPFPPSRRVFLEFGGKVYMIVPHGLVPMAVLGEALLGKGASQAMN